MTVADLIPSQNSRLPHPLEPWLWPASTQQLTGGDLAVSGVSISNIAARLGTPIQIVDLAEFRGRCADYRKAFYEGEVAYVGKALLTAEVVQVVAAAGLSLTVCSTAELNIAQNGGFPMERVILHGPNESPVLLRRALHLGVGRVVLNNLAQIDDVAHLCCADRPQQVLLRVAPRVEAQPCLPIATRRVPPPRGLSIATGAAAHAVRRIVAEPSLKLVGLHCHIGSQITTATTYEEAARQLLRLRAGAATEHGITLMELNLGGGHATAYNPADVPLWPWTVAAALRRVIRETCTELAVSEPRVTVEPGRAIAGPSGITVYRVTDVRRVGDRIWATVAGGGLGNHLLPAPHGPRYTARLLGRISPAEHGHLTVIGQTSGIGEVLVEEALLPADVRPGDLLAVPVSGTHVDSGRTSCFIPEPGSV